MAPAQSKPTVIMTTADFKAQQIAQSMEEAAQKQADTTAPGGVYIVNGGAPAGAAIAVPDQMNPGKALLLACNSMWGAAAEAAMLEDCKAWAATKGLQLGRRVEVRRVEWQPIV